MSHPRSSAGDAIPAETRVVEGRVADLRQLFNALGPRSVEYDAARIEYTETTATDAWRADWPAVSASEHDRHGREGGQHRGTVRRDPMSSDETKHQHTAEEEHKIREAALDRTIEGSFPASDPPSSNPNPDDHAALERQRPDDGRQDEAGRDV